MPRQPVVIAKRSGPDWAITYLNDDNKKIVMSVFGSPTIDDALAEAKLSLNAAGPDWYTIVRIELVTEKQADEN